MIIASPASQGSRALGLAISHDVKRVAIASVLRDAMLVGRQQRAARRNARA